MPIRRSIKDFLKAIRPDKNRDWTLIGLCLIISSLIWFFQSLNKTNYNTEIKFPIQIKHLREDVVAIEPPPEYIQVRISGSGWSLLQRTLGFGIAPLQIQIEDPTEVRFFTAKSLMPDIVQQLSDVRVEYIDEDSVFLNFDTLSSKTIQLMIDSSSIQTAEQHRVASLIKIIPDTTIVSGAASLVAQAPDSIWLSISEEDPLDESYQENIDLPLEEKRAFRVSTQEVEVSFEVDLYFRKSLTLPVEQINFPADSSVYLARPMAIVEYYVRRANEMQTLPDSLRIKADFAKRDKSDSTVLPTFEPLFFMEDVQVVPQKLQLIYASKKGRRNR